MRERGQRVDGGVERLLKQVAVSEMLRRRNLSRAAPAATSALKDNVRGFLEILDGKCQDLPEQAFYMVGTIEEAAEAAEKMAAETRAEAATA